MDTQQVPRACARCGKAGCTEHGRRHHVHRAGKTAERGYDAVYRTFREWQLHQRVICESVHGCREAATEVHHVRKVHDYPAGRLDPANMQCLCSRHHRALAGRDGRG